MKAKRKSCEVVATRISGAQVSCGSCQRKSGEVVNGLLQWQSRHGGEVHTSGLSKHEVFNNFILAQDDVSFEVYMLRRLLERQEARAPRAA